MIGLDAPPLNDMELYVTKVAGRGCRHGPDVFVNCRECMRFNNQLGKALKNKKYTIEKVHTEAVT